MCACIKTIPSLTVCYSQTSRRQTTLGARKKYPFRGDCSLMGGYTCSVCTWLGPWKSVFLKRGVRKQRFDCKNIAWHHARHGTYHLSQQSSQMQHDFDQKSTTLPVHKLTQHYDPVSSQVQCQNNEASSILI